MSDEQWNSESSPGLEMFLNGYLIGRDGRILEDDFYLLCFNSHHEPVEFLLPTGLETGWETIIDTAKEECFLTPIGPPVDRLSLVGRSLTLSRLKLPENIEHSKVMESLISKMTP